MERILPLAVVVVSDVLLYRFIVYLVIRRFQFDVRNELHLEVSHAQTILLPLNFTPV